MFKHTLIILAVVLLLILLLLVFARPTGRSADRPPQPDTVDKAIHTTFDAMEKTELISLQRTIAAAELRTNQPAPITLPELTDWLAASGLVAPGDLRIDTDARTIRDRWDRPIVLISEDSRLKAIASSGSDGLFQDGQGDDIIIPHQGLPAPLP